MESRVLGGGRSRDVIRGWVVRPGMPFPLEETQLILSQPVWLRGLVGGQLPWTPGVMLGSWGGLIVCYSERSILKDSQSACVGVP